MKRQLAVVGAALLAAAASIVVMITPADAAVGLHISGRNIVEANGQNFISDGRWIPTEDWLTIRHGGKADVTFADGRVATVLPDFATNAVNSRPEL